MLTQQESSVTVRSFGAVGDGVADDTTAINRAIAAGGTVLFDAGKTYRVRRMNPASQWPGGIVLRSGVTLSGYGATIFIDDDTNGVGSPSGPPRRTIVSNIAAGDRAIVLDSTDGLVKGQPIWFCYNQIPTNPAECRSYGFARIVAILENTIGLEQPLADALDVAATPVANRWLVQPELVKNAAIEGLSFVGNWAGGACIEAAINIQFGRNLRFKDLTFTEPGAGAIVLQYVDGAALENIRVLSAAQTNGGNSCFGHGLSFGETRNIRVTGFECSNFAKCAVDIEAACHNLWFDQVVLHDTDAEAFPAQEYFASGDGSDFAVGVITIDGIGRTSPIQARGTLATATGPLACSFETVIDNTKNGVGMDGGEQLQMTIGKYVRSAPAAV